ncbi:polysaccharide pyruvyl transferase family protein [Oxalobacteraceae sp. CFBP 8753]|nr:polysaccharide pyruvyl transferase family protein [Oxalobacteraceae sp. CFBP 8753]
MKIAFFSEQDPRLPRPFLDNSHSLMGNAGLNFGNLAFWYGAAGLSTDTVQFFGWNSKPDDILTCDLIMIPAANWLSNTTNFGFLADIIEHVNKPVIVMGLGIQSNKTINDIRLTEGTSRFVKSAASRSPSLLVRGSLTKEFLNLHGVENVTVGGCPSLFINKTLGLGLSIQKKIENLKDHGSLKMAVHALNHGDIALRRVERLLYSITSQFNSDYIIQSPQSFVKVLLNEQLVEKDLMSLRNLHSFIAPNISYEEFLRDIKNRMSFFNNIPSWILRLRQMHCVINTRIHGAMLGTAAGLPSICIYHDIRTKELSESTGIPSIGVQDLQEWDMDIHELFKISAFDGAAFDANRAKKAMTTRKILEDVGISVHDDIVKISTSA